MASIHHSPYAGSWYPEAEGELRPLLARVLETSRRRTGPYLLPNPIAFVVPHAGLNYSGTVAAAVYRHIQARQPRRIVLLGFSHRGGPAGVAIPDIVAIATPLGKTRIDGEGAAAVLAHREFHRVPEDWVCDHSVEIQLPLLQAAASEAVLLPLYVGAMKPTEQAAAARVLADLADDDTVFLASSDLTHFGRAFHYEPFPADGQCGERLAELDRGTIDDAGSLDASLFLAGLQETGSTVCGRAPIALLLRTLGEIGGEEIFQQTLDYQVSGEINGDYGHSVSYGALGYFPASSFELGSEDAGFLLESARAALAGYLRGGGRTGAVSERTPALTRRAGVFVTLHENGALRGCIGSATGRGPLGQTVGEMALSAALEDPRFPPLAPGASEAGISVDISVLSPLKRIRNRDSFRLHEHGIHLECGRFRSILLPQVSRDRGWGADRFWDALAHKAGCGDDVYADPATRLHVFRAQVIQ